MDTAQLYEFDVNGAHPSCAAPLFALVRSASSLAVLVSTGSALLSAAAALLASVSPRRCASPAATQG
eukprot:COSAG06_NODE_21983_length_738_cov_1.970266_3_plen_67_part_00